MASINQIAEILSERVGKKFDIAFQKELKVIINYWGVRLLKNSLEKHPLDRKYFYFMFTTPLVEVIPENCPFETEDCSFVTEFTVPRPVRVNNVLFDYVGAPSGNAAYGYYQGEWAAYAQYNYYGKRTKYVYFNDKIWVFYLDASDNPGELGVKGIFEDFQLRAHAPCYSTTCFDPDARDTIPQDLVAPLVTSILSTELKVIVNETA